MTNEQKRFKIQKIESYEKQISEENKEATKKTFLFGLAAAATLCFFAATAHDNINNALNMPFGLVSTGLSVYHLKGLIESISKKTNLQSKIENINSELEMPENEESRGMGR